MSQHLFPKSPAPPRVVDRVEFGVWSPDQIMRYSVVEIKHQETYENRRPKPGGLSDPHMGCVEQDSRCLTCDQTVNHCEGHFGHLMLARPVFHIGFLQKVKKILETVCMECARLRIPYSDEQGSKYQVLRHIPKKKDKFRYAWENSKGKRSCEHPDCGRQLLPIRKVANRLYTECRKSASGRAHKQLLTASRARDVLQRISDEDCVTLGLDPVRARPEWMILTVLPVPPPAIRPSVTMDTSGRGEDDLTHKLSDIIKYNNLIKNDDDEDGDDRTSAPSDKEEQLQYHISAYYDNENSGNPVSLQKSGKPTRSFRARLKGKDGRLRGNLQGKRVNHAARTVITGDPNLAIDQVGVPLAIARNLTRPETVCDWNRERLQRLVDRRSDYPGAKYVFTKAGERHDLRYTKEPIHLSNGDVVERHLVDNDRLLFNRQPTLHRPSMMSHRVKVMPFSTFRLNLSVTTPYNADFDGDEMNAHIPQSYETAAELQVLSSVPSMIISAQSNKPVMGIVQDALCGVNKFTQRDTFFGRGAAMNLVAQLPGCRTLPPPAILRPKLLWTGKQLFSMLLPDVDLVSYHSAHPDDEDGHASPGDTRVLIAKGELLAGIVCKRTVGTSAGGLIHVVAKDHGESAIASFMTDCQKLMNHFLLNDGFSVGMGDCLIDRACSAAIADTLQQHQVRAAGLAEGGDAKELDINKLLNSARDAAGRIAQRHLRRDNNFKQMVSAGSKGTAINISQIAACVGQQNVEGKRIGYGFHGRTLPHFACEDRSPLSRGFVGSSYRNGLSPAEFFFHAMGGREGLIDTAVKTAETGYIQRRLVKALEDVRAAYDGTVRNSRGDLIQILYGEDGMDGASLERQRITLVSADDSRLENMARKGNGLFAVWQSQFAADREWMREVFPDGGDQVMLPTNVARIVQRASRIPGPPVDDWEGAAREVEGALSAGSDLFRRCVRWALASSHLIANMSADGMRYIVDRVRRDLARGLVQPGEMVGVVAAQSIGEPATQMTLNTFHLAGVSNKNVTLGIPRLKELINTVKNMKTPSMTLQLDGAMSAEGAAFLASRVEHTLFRQVVSDCDVVSAEELARSEPWLRMYDAVPLAAGPAPGDLGQWALKIMLDRPKMWARSLSMDKVQEAVQAAVGRDGMCLATDDNAAVPMIVVRVTNGADDSGAPEAYFLRLLQNSLLDSLTLCGMPGVEKAYLEKKPVVVHGSRGTSTLSNHLVIETEGINLKESFSVKGLDHSLLYCNDPAEILAVFGVEAAREALLREIRSVIQFDGGHVSYRHLALLADVMTNRGQIMAITRHGINRTDAGPLMKCSFEETCDILFAAATDCEVDNVEGVAESIMLGAVAPMGTGFFDVLLDTEGLATVDRG